MDVTKKWLHLSFVVAGQSRDADYDALYRKADGVKLLSG